MSTDDRFSLDFRLTAGTALDHPLVGLERRRTAVAVAYLAALIGLFAVSYAGARITVDGVMLDTTTPRFDAVSTYLIALSVATMTILPLAYAVWNGGPGLAFAMPLVPVALGDLAAGRYVLDADTAIALTVGAAAAALALYATDVRTTGSLRPWRAAVERARVPGELVVVTILTVVAAVGVARFVAVVPPRHLDRYASFAGCWLVPLAVLGSYWVGQLRTTVAARAEREQVES